MIQLKRIVLTFLLLIIGFYSLYAGNPDRSGEAGADELLINPWARSSGWNGLNIANVNGLEAMRLNVGGLAFTEKTEVIFAHSSWLQGADIGINSFGFSQHVGESGVLGFELMSMSFGDIQTTTTSMPDGGIGTFSPRFVNLGVAYSREFSNSIYGGLTFRAITEAIANVKAVGVAFDAGIQYVAGADNNIKFGIALMNVGTPMRFNGDGLSFRGNSKEGDYELTLEQRSAKFELPALLNIGGAYDFNFKEQHRITVVASFTSNSFIQDHLGMGLEYAITTSKASFMLRGGYKMQMGVFKGIPRDIWLTGLSAGFTAEVPLKKDGPTFGLDYAFRATNPFQGTHTIGARINL